MPPLDLERNKMIASLLFVAAMLLSCTASGPSNSQSYGGYNQRRQLHQEQYQPQQQQDRWHAEVSSASHVAETSASTTEAKTPSEGAEPPLHLPEGWSEHFDPNSGQYYYYNAADGTTSWDRPEPPCEPEQQKLVGSETKGEDSQLTELNLEKAEATVVSQNSEQVLEHNHQDLSMAGIDGTNEKDTMSGQSSEYESWQSNQDTHMKQPGSTQPKMQTQPTNWGSQGRSDFTETDDRGPRQLREQQISGSQWAQSNSTDPSVVGGESEVHSSGYRGQPPHAQQIQGRSNGWGIPNQPKVDDLSQKPLEPWGVEKHPEKRHEQTIDPQNRPPPEVSSEENEGSSSDVSKGHALDNGRWGMPENTSSRDTNQNVDPSLNRRQAWQEPYPASSIQKSSESLQRTSAQQIPPHTISADSSSSSYTPRNTDHSHDRRQAWQEPNPALKNEKPPESPQRPSAQEFPPQDSKVTSQQYPPRPHYLTRQYPPPPHGSYNPNTPSGQVHYGGQNIYGRGYSPQQPPHSNPNSVGQLISPEADGETSAVKEALSTSWQGLLGFGQKTREVVGTARDQVVTGATAAGQSLSEKSSSIWESAKSTVGGVFENNDSGSQPYTLSGHNVQTPTENRQSYPGRPNGPSQGYPSVPVGRDGRGPPPRTFGGPQQQPGRYGSQIGRQPRYGAPPESGSIESSGRQQPPASHQQTMRPPGHPGMQPRRDHPYPQTSEGQERGPIKSQYENQPGSQQPGQGLYPGQHPGRYPQQRPPYPGPPQPDRGRSMAQGAPQQQKEPDPWDHPGLTGDY
mmetsp:Transcript_21876/g.52049  ORF Transcript_21876/g.52049 Transcript_21876/m.52049 type:complete len:794 (+) Transcript_21876:164-2545(+)|eukprot:CAMPEP_0197174310 /NCGR_PEP_ID=MMETSP1423-20130617/885_1 /TAXON_ID=476441 /ORGANISM="Pseudo-nitzschia heimii, Strain UNC1101" /LENGTH=793 /DNA_ID=CAMNT_0042623223 /DNA_START=152 /DNA_END=2533 /DNA_ORIENTATION=-